LARGGSPLPAWGVVSGRLALGELLSWRRREKSSLSRPLHRQEMQQRMQLVENAGVSCGEYRTFGYQSSTRS
ncbi:MAG TPA: hypothetical protein PKU97_06170, partial [Kofleriaceae bacterium]|nr:hypothetical protein [Kofleriaceae bacterium]